MFKTQHPALPAPSADCSRLTRYSGAAEALAEARKGIRSRAGGRTAAEMKPCRLPHATQLKAA